jgi:hypothetical protein
MGSQNIMGSDYGTLVNQTVELQLLPSLKLCPFWPFVSIQWSNLVRFRSSTNPRFTAAGKYKTFFAIVTRQHVLDIGKRPYLVSAAYGQNGVSRSCLKGFSCWIINNGAWDQLTIDTKRVHFFLLFTGRVLDTCWGTTENIVWVPVIRFGRRPLFLPLGKIELHPFSERIRLTGCYCR